MPVKITATYAGSEIKQFTLKEIYLGCALPGNNTAGGPPGLGPPVSCRVKFTGTTTKEKKVQAICAYTVSEGFDRMVSPCVLGSDFRKLVSVDVENDESLKAPKKTVAFLDDVVHCNRYY